MLQSLLGYVTDGNGFETIIAEQESWQLEKCR